MDVLSPFLLLLFRSLVILLQITIGWLAFRRLAMSKSDNAWIYGATCLFAAVTTAGLLPWALGLTAANWVFFILAAICPAVWVGVVALCDYSRRTAYGPDPVASVVLSFRSLQKSAPTQPPPPTLVLERPDWPEAPKPVFRHADPEEAEAEPEIVAPKESRVSAARRSLMSIAREMRGNNSSEARRPKLLPSPDPDDLPFIKGQGRI